MAHLRITISETHLAEHFPELLTESMWVDSGISDLYMRVDAARPEMKQKRHVHIAHKKHINSPSKQVAWNDDKTRHDRGRFDDGFKGMEQAKAVTRIALKMSDDQVLESFQARRFDQLFDTIMEQAETGDALPVVDYTFQVTG